MYKLMKTKEGYEFIRRLTDGANIPYAEDNTDYRAYLAWLELGNSPEPADNEGTV